MAAALPPLCMEVRPNRARLSASTLPPGHGASGRTAAAEPNAGETDDLQNCYGFPASTDRSPSKKGVLSGLPDNSAQDQAAWPLSPIQIGRVFAHGYPGRRTRSTNIQAAILESCSCGRCLFGVRGFVSDLVHERSVVLVFGLRLSVLFDSVKFKLSELVAAQPIPPI